MIKGAFAQYLSPDMVDSLILDPEKLKLGGSVVRCQSCFVMLGVLQPFQKH